MIFVAKLSSPLCPMRLRQSLTSTRLTTKSTSDFGSKTVDPQSKKSDNVIPRNPSKPGEAVPETLQEALSVFLQHPTPLGTIFGIFCIASYRLTSSFSISDLISSYLKIYSFSNEAFSWFDGWRFLDFSRMVHASISTAFQSGLDG